MAVSDLVLILVSVTLSGIAQVSFKFGVSFEQNTGAGAPVLAPLAFLFRPGVLLGLFLYGVGTILWLLALGRVELSKAYPFIGVGFALTTLAGWWLFHERITVPRTLGIFLIASGIFLVAKS